MGQKQKTKKDELPEFLRADTEDYTAHEDIAAILDFFGVKSTEGNVIGLHWCAILSYLQKQKTGELKDTLSKLTCLMHIDKRRIKENYIEGLISWGVIEISFGSSLQLWRWIGWKGIKEKKNT